MSNNKKWIAVGADRAHLCTFCGRPSAATVGCPDDGAPILFQVGMRQLPDRLRDAAL
jgi:hypothetical protein